MFDVSVWICKDTKDFQIVGFSDCLNVLSYGYLNVR